MDSCLVVFFTIIVAIIVPGQVQSFLTNPFDSLKGVVKNENNNILSDVISDVRRMQMKNPFSGMLLGGEPIGNRVNLNGQQKLQTPFNWTSCGPSNQVMEIKKLTITPDPISLPGSLTFAFDIVFHQSILASENITVVLKLEIMAGSSWLKIPCLGSIGSCTYPDLCSSLKDVSCPGALKKRGIPCNCPFKKGEYNLDKFTQEIDAEVFIPGNYRVTANLSSSNGKKVIGCYQIFFTAD